MLRKVSLVVAAAVLCICGSAQAVLIDPDGGDTQFTPIDLGDIDVSYDSQNLYIQYVHDHDGWTGVQVGVALVTVPGGGGPTDPWGHQIAFAGMCLPTFIAYMNLDSQWNEWCIWAGTDWNRIPNILNWQVLGPVDVLVLPWELLGVNCYNPMTQIFMEMWITQDSPTKGPLDLSYNDALQLSTPGGTTWDITTPVVISCYHCIYVYGPSATDQTTWSGVKNLWR